jgi:hypothetical protein
MTEPPSGEDRESAEEGEGRDAATTPTPVATPEAVPAPVRRAGSGQPGIAWFAAVLVLVIAGVAASPFWAPAITPMLPWGERAAGPSANYAALAARLEVIEKRTETSDQALAAVRSGEAGLAQRIDRLEAAELADGGLKSAVAAAQGELARLGQRLDAADARAASMAGDLQGTTRGLAARLDKLDGRIGALEGRTQAAIGAGRTDAALLLSLLQLHAAVEAGRPFAPQYDGFAALAQGHPDLVAAAGPLADTAGGGIASNATLRQGLAKLADRLKTAAPPPARQNWWEAALSQLRGLVTVRRIGAPPRGPEAAVDQAQAALATGDLPGAVAALAALSATDAAAAQPWLQMARARLAAEAALARLQDLLTARLGAAPAASPNGAMPTNTPAPAAAKPGAPS